MKNSIFTLKIEDMSSVGGPMHSARSYLIESLIFTDIDKAKEYSEAWYGDKIKWKKFARNEISSGDLRWIMFTIIKTKVDPVFKRRKR